MNLLYKYTKQKGYTEIINPNNSPLEFIKLGLLQLAQGESFGENSGAYEVVLVVLGGRCTVICTENTWQSLGVRNNVFDGKAYAVYIPGGKKYEIIGETMAEIAICKAPAKISGAPQLITPANVQSKLVGKDNWQREVQTIIGDEVNAQRLIVGETINPAGNWSSYPPHKHDEDSEDEVKLEEAYHFRVQPVQGFGLQRIYTGDGSVDEVYIIRNCDTIAIPKGYHPVVAAPGYRVYYLWVLAGERRVMKPKDDPEHAWIHKKLKGR